MFALYICHHSLDDVNSRKKGNKLYRDSCKDIRDAINSLVSDRLLNFMHPTGQETSSLLVTCVSLLMGIVTNSLQILAIIASICFA